MIEVSTARPTEITETVKLARRLHAQSDWAWVPFSAAAMRKSLTTMLRRPDYCVFLARNAGDLCGLLIGSVDTVIYGRTRFSTDIEFIADHGGDELLEAFKQWSGSMGSKIMIMTVSTSGREPVMDRFFRKHGFEKVGGTYQLRLT